MMIQINISDIFDKTSINDFLKSFYISKSKIYQLNNHIYINELPARMNDQLNTNDRMIIDFSPLGLNTVKPYQGDIEILYEDSDVLVLNKQKDILVHTDGNTIDTLTNRVAYHYHNAVYPILPVHRLDFETSGILVFAKHPLAHAYLAYQFENRLVEKTYIAMVLGVVMDNQGVIDKPIARDRHSDKQIVFKNGKEAKTIYEVIKRFQDKTLVKINIIGGRKHQIRVHFESIGHPIIGDKRYGHFHQSVDSLKLHFKNIKFMHPTLRTYSELDTKKDHF